MDAVDGTAEVAGQGGGCGHSARVMSACHNSLGSPAASRRQDGRGVRDGLAGPPRAGMRPARFRLERRLALGQISATMFTTQAPLAPRFRSSKARGDQQCRSTPAELDPRVNQRISGEDVRFLAGRGEGQSPPRRVCLCAGSLGRFHSPASSSGPAAAAALDKANSDLSNCPSTPRRKAETTAE